MRVWIDCGPELSVSNSNYLVTNYASQFPQASLISPPSNRYNCYAYTFGNLDQWYRDDPIDWVRTYCTLLLSGNLYPTISQLNYIDANSVNVISYGGGSLDHLGLYYGSVGQFQSKWGVGGLYIHNMPSCPYWDTNLVKEWAVYRWK